MAIYVYRTKPDFTLEQIISASEQTITAIVWSPHDPNTLASVSTDSTVAIWDLAQEKKTYTTRLPSEPTAIDWSPRYRNTVAIGTCSGTVTVWNHDQRDTLFLKDSSLSQIQVLRYNARYRDRFVAGFADGTVSMYDINSKKLKKIKYKHENGQTVVDIRWDPLSDNYMLIAFSDGQLVLYDADADMALSHFEKPTGGVRSIDWLFDVPGGFVTTDARSGALRVWNVSHPDPIETIRVKKTGFQNLVFLKGTKIGVCTFRDGSVGCYDLATKKWQGLSEPGHTETIFDCRFRTTDPDILATGSYDGSVRVWNISTMGAVQTLPGTDGVIYGLSWSPSKSEARLAASTSKGTVVIWNVDEGKRMYRHEYHKNAVFRVAWNQLDANVIASCSRDGYCVVSTVDGKIIQRYKHDRAAVGCDWSPFDKHQLATGCHDGIVRVFNVANKGSRPIRELKGHSDVVFNVVWSPLIPDCLMSGSDDKTIRVWNVNTPREAKVLKGHTKNVRALVWSPEIPYLALSGSWDGTIRIWDTRKCTCLEVIYDHHADVYGLACHPARPFVFASSSRDTTLRMWVLDDLVARLRLKAVQEHSIDSVLGDAVATMRQAMPPALCGSASKELSQNLKSTSSLVKKFGLICDFFYPPRGTRDLWRLVNIIDDKRKGDKGSSSASASLAMVKSPSAVDGKANPSAASASVMMKNKAYTISHISEVIPVATAEATELETVRHGPGAASAVGSGKKDDRVVAAADIYLKLGQFKKYCECMISIDQWEQAIGVAPAAGVKYWKQLCQKYARKLAVSGHVDTVKYFLMAGDIDSLVEYYVSRRELDDAMLVAKVSVDEGYPELSDVVSPSLPSSSVSSPVPTSVAVPMPMPMPRASVALTQAEPKLEPEPELKPAKPPMPTATTSLSGGLVPLTSSSSSGGGGGLQPLVPPTGRVLPTLAPLKSGVGVLPAIHAAATGTVSAVIAPSTASELPDLTKPKVQEEVEPPAPAPLPVVATTATIAAPSQSQSQSQSTHIRNSSSSWRSNSASVTPTVSEEDRKKERRRKQKIEAVNFLSNSRANVLIRGGEPSLAAAAHLATGDVNLAVQKLIEGNEIELAYMLCEGLNVNWADHVFHQFAMRCVHHGLWKNGLTALDRTRDPQPHKALLAASFIGSQDGVTEIYLAAGLTPPGSLPEPTIALPKSPEDPVPTSQDVRRLVSGRNYLDGLVAGVAVIRSLLSPPQHSIEAAGEVVKTLASVPLPVLETHDLKNELLAFSAYIGLVKAVWRGYLPIMEHMLATYRSLVSTHRLNMPVSIGLAEVLYAQYITVARPDLAGVVVNQLLNSPSLPSELHSIVLTLKNDIQKNLSTQTVQGIDFDVDTRKVGRNTVMVAGSNLPTATNTRRPILSVVSRRQVIGPVFLLEDGQTAVGLSEAIMWAKCNPFSPLCTGSTINPY